MNDATAEAALPLPQVSIIEPTDPAIAGAQAAKSLAESFVIEDEQSLELAATEAKTAKATAKRLREMQRSMTRPLDEAKKRIMDFFRAALAFYDETETTYKRKMIAFTQEQDRKRQAVEAEARRKAEEEQRAAEEEAQKRAAAAEAAGDSEGAQRELDAAATAPPPPVMVPPPPRKPQGVNVRDNWQAEVTDFDALIKAAHEGNSIARACITPDMKTIRQQAKSLKDRCKIPGVRIWNQQTAALRSN